MQIEFQFGNLPHSDDIPDGLAVWRETRRAQFAGLARSLGLPLGKEAEVWLQGGVRLRGKLELDEEILFAESVTLDNIRFRIARAVFQYSEVESCVRL